jgi:cellulose synthase/poly-beta-1,6-N-acetylglucosamine synthase-like glycosyltransferase
MLTRDAPGVALLHVTGKQERASVNSDLTNHRYPFDLSVVLPVYNEEDNLLPLHEELSDVLDSLGRSYEIVYVDDGSRDSSQDKIIALAAAHPESVRSITPTGRSSS